MKKPLRRRKSFNFILRIASSAKHPGNELFEYVADSLQFGDASIGSFAFIVTIEFDRAAPSFAEAVYSAISEVEAVPGLFVDLIEHSEFVTASEIAQRTGKSREAVRLWAASRRRSGGFPKAADGFGRGYKFWHWSEVLGWLLAQGLIKSAELDYARVTEAINAALAVRRLRSKLPAEDRKIVSMLARGAVRAELAASA